VAGALAMIGASVISRRQQQLYVVVLAGASTFLVYSATVLTSGIEHQRHAVTAAVMVRVVALAAIAAATSGHRARPAHALLDDEHEQ
jgi:predicted ribosome-associated RNA-binding protein Tma20